MKLEVNLRKLHIPCFLSFLVPRFYRYIKSGGIKAESKPWEERVPLMEG